jgi:hypothetical protein
MGWFSSDEKEGELVQAKTPRIVMIDKKENCRGKPAELYLKTPLTINHPEAFNITREDARVAISRFVKFDGWTDSGLEDLIAALVFEYVDQEFRG